ncbi:putative Reverse transcriptase (RNA-dependent DNA polymerase)/RNase H [Trypanosoma cruzi]|nr:putative Reverse transcriptase (RNA-dependent DNA polymerase)/RNase H [Trypanosoma cruzi]
MIHRRLSALLPHHPRQFGFAPSRSTSDVVALVIGKITRGLNEFSIVEYERPGGGAPTRHACRHRLWSRLIFRLRSTPLTMGSYSACLTEFRALATEPKRWLHNYLRGRYVRVCTRVQHSRKQLASAGVLQGGVPGPQLFLYCVDDLLRRLGNIYSASAFMNADEHTLVASDADIHACAAAMRPLLSLVATWLPSAAQKSTLIRAKPLYSTSLQTHGLTRKWSISFLTMGDYAFSHAQCAYWATRSIEFLILACAPSPLQSRPCHAAISCDRSHKLVSPITPCDPF